MPIGSELGGTTPLVLGTIALVLTGPVPSLLARSSWPVQVPRAALALWQSVALAAVLAAFGAGLSAASGALATAEASAVAVALCLVPVVLTVSVGVRLAWAGHVHGTRVRARRRHHRALVDIAARQDERAPGVHVIDTAAPLAYSIPGARRGRVVLSGRALDDLSADELAAVLEHERSHLRARHDLLLEAFTVLHAAFPHWVRSRTALNAVSGLVEMLADDAARRRAGDLPLARALVALAGARAPAGTMAATPVTPGPAATLVRVNRLGKAPGRRPRRLALSGAVYAIAAALVITPTVTVALPWLATTLDRLT